MRKEFLILNLIIKNIVEFILVFLFITPIVLIVFVFGYLFYSINNSIESYQKYFKS